MEALRQKFPGMRPMSGTPPLFRLNGIGVSVYGKRDVDEETGTYIKTLCLCVLFVPLIPLAAYRVADASNGGWFFLGKERLSNFARSWNLAALGIALLLGMNLAWTAHTSSPEYIARQDLRKADAELQAGHGLKAAALYQRVANGTASADQGRTGLKAALDQCLTNDQPATVAGALSLVAHLPKRLNQPEPVLPDAFERGLSLVAQFRSHDPEGALAILKASEGLATTNTVTKPLRIELLKEILAAKPNNVDCAVELALVYETDEHLDDAVKVLRPVREQLGSTEGARILGQQLLQEGNNEASYALLYPYVQSRLEKLRAIESTYTNAIAQSSKSALDHLRKGKADRSFYDNYERASKADQGAMVDAFIEKWMKDDDQIARASKNLVEANQIVHVTLDLGIVQLGRAQNLGDPAARKTELEAAEKTFLAIRGFAGKSDEYRMFLGQVYYWLGKSTEGRQLFDELLTSRQRGFRILLALAQTLRLVGEYQQARDLCEEAYGKAPEDKQKFEAASLRAHCQKDLDDEIAWLEKCDPQTPVTQIELNSSRGQKALQKGDRAKATGYFRKAIAGYDEMPKSTATLNNQGLACLNLYTVSGDLRDHTRGLELLESAVAMDPGNSILLENTAQCLVGRAYLDVVHDALLLGVLKEDPDDSMLGHLYSDDASRAQIYQRLQDNEHMKKALNYFDKALLLAPKQIGLYRTVMHLQSGFRNTPELQKLQQRLQTAAPDFTQYQKEWVQYFNGSKDKEQLETLQAGLAKLEPLLNNPEVQQSPATLERVKSSLVGTHEALAMYGGRTDADADLALARDLQAHSSSTVAQFTLISALFFKADAELKAQDATYAALAEKTRHALGAQQLITLCLERGGPTADRIRANPHVREAVNQLKAGVENFPSSPRVGEWAVLRVFAPDAANTLATRIKASALTRLVDELDAQLNPMKASAVLDQHWNLELAGDQAGAEAVLQAAAQRGIPLP
jgi:tetratricopeptide (TPR) repeat protein